MVFINDYFLPFGYLFVTLLSLYLIYNEKEIF